MFKDNDSYLLKELHQGNKKAYAHLFNSYYTPLCNYVYSYTKNTKQAEDIVQDSLLKIWENRHKIKPQHSVKNYLYKIAYNQFIDNDRKNKKHLNYIDEVKRKSLNNLIEKDDDFLENKKAIILFEVQKLPPKCKEVFLLNKQNGLKYKEIAEELDISIRTVENHISKALKIIRNKIKQLRKVSRPNS